MAQSLSDNVQLLPPDAERPVIKPIPTQLDVAQLDLTALLTPAVDSRIAAADVLKRQPLAFERSPAPAPTQKTLGTISEQEALSAAIDVNELSADGVNLPINSSFDLAAFGKYSPPSRTSSRFFFPFNRIIGTPEDDDITGTLKNDFISGLAGDDTMRGDNGNDIIVGGAGNDIISGDHVPSRTTISNDIIAGGSGNDKLFGRIGNDLIFGGSDDDQIFGGSGRDNLYGGSGNDQMFGGIVEGDAIFNSGPDGDDRMVGGSGNDFLDGGIGSDYIDGSNSYAKGAGEVDLLSGGQGADTFVLGSYAGAYYVQGGANQDFAIILDFEQGDTVQLYGEAADYVLSYDSTENATAIGYLGSGSYEFVGVFAGQDLSHISTTDAIFQYL